MASVNKCYTLEGGVVRWTIKFRRSLRVQEQRIFEEMLASLGDLPIYVEEEDECVWSKDSLGTFSAHEGVRNQSRSLSLVGIRSSYGRSFCFVCTYKG